jgi:type I restriction enzyme S subunit
MFRKKCGAIDTQARAGLSCKKQDSPRRLEPWKDTGKFVLNFTQPAHEIGPIPLVPKGTIVTYGIVQAGEEYTGGIPYIRTGDIVGGEIAKSGLRHTDPTIAARFERSRVEAGHIVMSIRATVGTTAVVPPDLDGANLTQGTARISPGDSVDGLFLLSFLRTSGTQHWISLQIKGATFREITLTRLRELPVVVRPPVG